MVSLLFILTIFFNQSIEKNLIYFITFILLCSIIPFIVTQKFIFIKAGFLLSVIFFFSFQTSDLIFNKKIITFLYFLSLLIILGGWIGFIYAKNGGTLLFEVNHPEIIDDKIFFYLTTFTNHVVNNNIRPSGIFDEPGSLVFFIKFLVVIMELNKFPKYQSFLLLLTSIITNSFVGLILLITYGLMNYRIKFIVIFLFFLFLIFLNYNFFYFFEDIFLRVTSLESIIYNNRTTQVLDFFFRLDMMTFLYGHELSEINQYDQAQPASPFTILWGHGFFMYIIFLLIEFWLIYKFFFGTKRVQFSAIALFLLLLQRPFLYSLFWGFTLAYPLVVLYKYEKKINKHHAK